MPSPPGSAVTDDGTAMDLALAQARLVGEEGEVPVGAVVVRGGTVLAAAGNRREESGDPSAHAEILALREACEKAGTWRLEDATMFVTLEPCAMCAGALLQARVARLVFAVADPKAGACGSLYNLCCDPRLNHEIVVESGPRATEAGSLLSDWFAQRRR